MQVSNKESSQKKKCNYYYTFLNFYFRFQKSILKNPDHIHLKNKLACHQKIE